MSSTYSFYDAEISTASLNDLSAIENLLNRAYRGEESNKGWTTESHLIAGNIRTTLQHLQELLEQANSVFLIYKKEGQLIASVNLQKQDTKLYLGMFAVEPNQQGAGIGKKILNAAEEWANHVKCNSIFMTVISVRYELINWYKKNGYVDTGKRQAFEEDGYSGNHLQKLEFMVLEKKLR